MRPIRLILLLVIAGSAVAGRAQTPTDENAKLRAQAIELYKQSKYLEALPLFEKLAVAYPKDPLMHEGLAVSLVSHSATMSGPSGNAERVRARAEFLKAKELGDNSDIVAVELEMLPPDGVLQPVSPNAEASTAFDKAEACFSQRDMDCAIAEYTKALKADPQLYDAALFLGDSYFVKKDLENASRWFSHAISLKPDVETAYRYWGDALLQAGKPVEAREKFVEAYITNPYTRATQGALQKWANQNLVKIRVLHIASPNSVTEQDGKPVINMSADALKRDDGSEAWILCDMSRPMWRSERFQKTYPREKEYRHSLAEEADCLDMTAVSVSQLMKDKKPKNLDPALAALMNLKAKGLIEAYVLLNAADEGIVQDFEAYRSAHRDKLRQYVNEVMLPQ